MGSANAGGAFANRSPTIPSLLDNENGASLHLQSILTCTDDSHQGTCVALATTPHCVILTKHCGAQWSCCQVSGP